MIDRAQFSQRLGQFELTHVERAVAFLWYYRQTQQFEERTATELASDIHEGGFPRPHVTKLHRGLMRTKYTIQGRKPKTFQLDVRYVPELDERYATLLKIKIARVSDAMLPHEWVIGTRPYLEKLFHQINGTYDYGFYDGCAVLCRRLMESLIIEVYVSKELHQEIRQNDGFFQLDRLIGHIRNHGTIRLGRNTGKAMESIKKLGDTAAHDRTYITLRQDLEDIKLSFRLTIQELLALAGIMPKPT